MITCPNCNHKFSSEEEKESKNKSRSNLMASLQRASERVKAWPEWKQEYFISFQPSEKTKAKKEDK